MIYTARAKAYPCPKKCEEVVRKLEFLRDILQHGVDYSTSTENWEEVLSEYRKNWFDLEELFQSVFETKSLILWKENQFGRYMLYETELAVDNVYFINNIEVDELDMDSLEPVPNITLEISDVDELVNKLKEVFV